jgi:hypothetical protein
VLLVKAGSEFAAAPTPAPRHPLPLARTTTAAVLPPNIPDGAGQPEGQCG